MMQQTAPMLERIVTACTRQATPGAIGSMSDDELPQCNCFDNNIRWTG